jgi:antitoxin YokJ
MTEVARLVQELSSLAGCRVDPPRGQPRIRPHDVLPKDLEEFFAMCGGVRLFEASEYAIRIVGPAELTRANPEIVGQECPKDMTDSWYLVARAGSEEALSIDCSLERLGRCYDSFWDCHGVAGDCRIVALSFSELLARLVATRGDYWYWLAQGGSGHGDAYDR